MIKPLTLTAPGKSFTAALRESDVKLHRDNATILQLNTGALCNLTCVHCHVNAGPKRKEIITADTIDKVLVWFEKTTIPTLDLTGGTPEMVPDFRRLVEAVRNFKQPRTVMTRLNATILNEPGYEWIPEFHAKHKVTIIASMPCYSPDNVNEQRGDGVFDSSIKAFKTLNALGYGIDPELPMHFVYNPNGAFLPGDQRELEADYKREMKAHFDIHFNDLYSITNMPIARFASYLRNNDLLVDYMQTLRDAFNPASIAGLMCRDTISVGWQGDVFDCDFNQQLKMPTAYDKKNNVKLWDIDLDRFRDTPIIIDDHCFGCTAGAGSSCGGALVD